MSSLLQALRSALGFARLPTGTVAQIADNKFPERARARALQILLEGRSK